MVSYPSSTNLMICSALSSLCLSLLSSAPVATFSISISSPNHRFTGTCLTTLFSPMSTSTVSGGGSSSYVVTAIGKKCVGFPDRAAINLMVSMASGSNLLSSTRPVSFDRRSRPPLGASQSSLPPSRNRRVTSWMVLLLWFCLAGFNSGTSSMCFLEYTVTMFLPRVNGTAKRSSRTLSPAMKIIFSPRVLDVFDRRTVSIA
mmetsp:Transcript_5454/g.16267  ORF Transcript_5454/g.16267 Transcript_5454/m.16267 type:complete len:202 (+) Transcript_5454:125-730(+)